MRGLLARLLCITGAVALPLALLAVIGWDSAGPVWVFVHACARAWATAASLPVVLALSLTLSVWFLAIGHGWRHARAADEVLRLAAARATSPTGAVLAVSRQLGIRRLIVTDIPEPLVFCAGLLRPAVVVSSSLITSLSPPALAAVLAHEAAHARRRDPLRQIVAYAIARGLWIAPAARRGADHLRLRLEVAADRAAARYAGRRALAEALLALHVQPAASHAVAGGASELAARIDALVGGSAPPRLTIGRAVMVRSLIGLTLTLTLVVVALIGPGVGSDPVAPMPMRGSDFADMGLAWGLRLAAVLLAWKAVRVLLNRRAVSDPAPSLGGGVGGNERLSGRRELPIP